ncbi:major facilitator superfamily domain-containing protein [Aspergillus stella-maris]|uniref:major facilitator superfamily domain-containing protein n=1 Tax=Aspergillus stella-maris TaxID=1810926 RepID=UPI003CCDC296
MDEKTRIPSPTEISEETGAGETLTIDPKYDRELTTKLDLRLIPVLGLVYLICFLDRTNIANARIAGLEDGLNMPPTGYNTCLWIFYIPFVLCEIPSNMIMALPWVKPNLWLGGLMFVLGILAMCQGLTHSYGGLLAVRFLMGIVETALPAGSAFLLSTYYRKKEIALRMGCFYAFGQAGACFSGLLAYAIMDMDGTGGYEGWRWIFILEGLVTLVFSAAVFTVVPNFPSRATWLKPVDREALLARLDVDKGLGQDEPKKQDWINAAADPKIWILTLLFFCADMSAGSLSSFNPTILSQLGWTSRRAQVMTIPIWVVGTSVGLIAALLAGKTGNRSLFIFPSILISVVGWALHYCQIDPPGVRYFAQFAIAIGTLTQMPLYSGLLLANLRGKASLSLGSGIQFGLGNCANFVASNVFIDKQKPAYPIGFGTGLGITAAAFPIMGGVVLWFVWHNKKVELNGGVGDGNGERGYRYVL